MTIRKFKRPTFGRALFDGPLPVDLVMAGSLAIQKRAAGVSDGEDFDLEQEDIEDETP